MKVCSSSGGLVGGYDPTQTRRASGPGKRNPLGSRRHLRPS